MTKSPKFENPPVEEVVCGIRFKPLDLPIQQILEIRELLKGKYPKTQSAARLHTDIKNIELFSELPLPRLWFINADDDRVIQIQDDHFLFNWRKRPPNDGYPKFETIFEEFQGILGQFEAYINEQKLGEIEFQGCELSYINNIPKGAAWKNFADLGKIFTKFDFDFSDQPYLKNLLGFGSSLGFALPEDKGRLTVSCTLVEKIQDKTKSIQLQFSAKGLGADQSREAVMDWFQMAHDHIVFGFCEMTEYDAQVELWGRTQ